MLHILHRATVSWLHPPLLLMTLLSLSCLGLVHAAESTDREKSPSAGALSPCQIQGLDQVARCGVFDVPENPDRPDGRRLQISVAVIPAADGPALPDPIVPLMGGPGEDAISAASFYVEQFASLRRNRDLVLIDQRGTGQSSALRCDLHSEDDPATSLRDFFPVAAVEECARRLSKHADLTQYTYAHFANDVEHVRRALGYGALNLSAGSYGTRAAQVYVRMYPQSVRTVYLGSVVPIDVPTPLTMAKSAQKVLDDTFRACAADSACGAAFPNVRDELLQVLDRLESGAVRVSIPGRVGSAPLHRGRVAEWFRSNLYRPADAATLPWLIHRAYEGDWSPIVEGILAQARGLDSAIGLGLFFSITCNADIAFVREQDVAPETQGTFLGDYRLRQQQAACKSWPKVSFPEDYRTLVRSPAPTMFVSGDSDGASPLWYTEHVAPGFSNRVEIVHGGKGHTEWSDCVARLYERFVRSGAVRGLDGSSCKTPRPPFKTPELSK